LNEEESSFLLPAGLTTDWHVISPDPQYSQQLPLLLFLF